ncbi:hypothetical protein ABZY16_07765 [Streptomyces sp. NPDC006553]|uniref:hypothetical protein n=1 Tax=unclassified Streptomyces TaxID=2593676 RepID=UPI00225B004A|nr:hypothetical protein [Streptomyces sp. NBC_00233]MCX5232561.1 hypothetical protein [Streptomyces sp. NBC_00233]
MRALTWRGQRDAGVDAVPDPVIPDVGDVPGHEGIGAPRLVGVHGGAVDPAPAACAYEWIPGSGRRAPRVRTGVRD